MSGSNPVHISEQIRVLLHDRGPVEGHEMAVDDMNAQVKSHIEIVKDLNEKNK